MRIFGRQRDYEAFEEVIAEAKQRLPCQQKRLPTPGPSPTKAEGYVLIPMESINLAAICSDDRTLEVTADHFTAGWRSHVPPRLQVNCVADKSCAAIA